jgi:hypothetical protein
VSLSPSSDAPGSDVADVVAFIVTAASTLIAQMWGVRVLTVHKVLSTPEAVSVVTTRYLLALASGKDPTEAAGDVGRSLLADAEERAA